MFCFSCLAFLGQLLGESQGTINNRLCTLKATTYYSMYILHINTIGSVSPDDNSQILVGAAQALFSGQGIIINTTRNE